MKKKIIVLGAGMVGTAMAIDLVGKHNVSLADRHSEALEKAKGKCPDLHTVELDVTEYVALKETIGAFDLVICAVPGFLGFQTLKAIIESGKNVVDISFFPENSLELDALAAQHHVTAIVDCGVAPGMGNMILGQWDTRLKVTQFECLVGGLPKVKQWPFCYKAPFSPIDVIEEYTRPARYVESGNLVVRDPLTDCEYVEFDKVGTLEAFNSDGLRTLIDTMPHIPNMKEKTLRYPGHVEYIRVLKDSGFFATDPIPVNGALVTPLDFTSELLFKAWKLGDTEEEFTVMRIAIEGEDEKGESIRVVYDLYDAYDTETSTSSMARTTGYTATAAAELILDGVFSGKGVFPPELVGRETRCFDYVLKYLADRGVNYEKTIAVPD